jgi:hypothetical protein
VKAQQRAAQKSAAKGSTLPGAASGCVPTRSPMLRVHALPPIMRACPRASLASFMPRCAERHRYLYLSFYVTIHEGDDPDGPCTRTRMQSTYAWLQTAP